MSLEVPIAGTHKRLPENASLNQNVTMKFLHCPAQTGPYFGTNFTILKDNYSFRTQQEKE